MKWARPEATLAISILLISACTDPTPGRVRLLDGGVVGADQSVTTEEDKPVWFPLAGPPPYELLAAPQHGLLQLAASIGEANYTPAANFHGRDSFVYANRDRQLLVAIDIAPLNDAPRARSSVVTVSEGLEATFTFTVSDADGDEVVVEVVGAARYGSITVTGLSGRYVPPPGFTGDDEIRFTASDGQQTSAEASVRFQVAANRPPVAVDQEFAAVGGTTTGIELVATDPDSDPLTFEVTTPPEHGVLSGEPPHLSYSPEAEFVGPDTLVFKVSDGRDDDEGLVRIVVQPGVQLPIVPVGQSVTVQEDTPTPLDLAGYDPNGMGVAFRVTQQPAHGTLTGDPPALLYSPAPEFSGLDSIHYRVENTFGQTEGIIDLRVVAVNDPPTAHAQTLEVEAGEPLAIELGASDPDSEQLRFEVTEGPRVGTLEGAPPSLTYRAPAHYVGRERVEFVVRDAASSSEAAAIEIVVIGRADSDAGVGDGGAR